MNSDFPVTHDKKGQVQGNDKHRKTDTRNGCRHQGYTHNTAVDNAVRRQKDIQSECINKSAEGKPKGSEKIFRNHFCPFPFM